MYKEQSPEETAAFNALMIDERELNEYIAGRDESDHINIKPASAFYDRLVSHFSASEPEGDVMPWKKTHDSFRFRHSEVTIWNGINGHGKSVLLGQIIMGFMRSRRACVASLEMKPETTLTRMIRQALGGRSPTNEFIATFLTRAEGKLWLYDQQGTVTSQKLLGVMYYAAEKLLVDHFVIDSLMKCGIGEDDYNRQKQFVDQLCAFAKDTECHVHLVTHAKKADDEHQMPGKMSVKGSGSITDQVDNVITVWRNKRKEQKKADGKLEDGDNTPDAFLICDKQRNGEWEGRIGLWYDVDSMRYTESPWIRNKTDAAYT